MTPSARSLAVALLFLFALPVGRAEEDAPDPPRELASLRDSWKRARAEAVAPLDRKYLDALSALKARFRGDEKLLEAALVDEEIGRLESLMDKSSWDSLVGRPWRSIDGGSYFLKAIRGKQSVSHNGQTYTTDDDIIYAHAPGKIVYELPLPVTEFQALGCIESRSKIGRVIFVVETAAGEVFRSEPVTGDNNSVKVSAKFPPTRNLVLSVEPDGSAYEDWSFWLHPKVR